MFMGARVEKGSHALKLIVNNSLGPILNAKIHSGQPQHWKIIEASTHLDAYFKSSFQVHNGSFMAFMARAWLLIDNFKISINR